MTTNKSNSQDTLSWLENIVTWALLGIAGYQFTHLSSRIEHMYEEVITHKEKLKRNDKDIEEIKSDVKQLMTNRQQAKVSQKQY